MYSKKQLREEIRPLLWDTDKDVDYYIRLFEKEDRSPDEDRRLKNLYIKILNYNHWHKVVKMFDYQILKNEVVVDDVIQGLFPRPLRKKYRYVKQLL